MALKVVHPHLLKSDDAVVRSRREIEIGKTIRHPSVVRTLDGGEADAPETEVGADGVIEADYEVNASKSSSRTDDATSAVALPRLCWDASIRAEGHA